jgi:hypothetical protein
VKARILVVEAVKELADSSYCISRGGMESRTLRRGRGARGHRGMDAGSRGPRYQPTRDGWLRVPLDLPEEKRVPVLIVSARTETRTSSPALGSVQTST